MAKAKAAWEKEKAVGAELNPHTKDDAGPTPGGEGKAPAMPDTGMTGGDTDATSHPPGSPRVKWGEKATGIDDLPDDEKGPAILKALGMSDRDEFGQNLSHHALQVYKSARNEGESPGKALKRVSHVLDAAEGESGEAVDMAWTQVNQYKQQLREQDLKNYTPHAVRSYVDKLPAEYRAEYYRNLLK